MANEKVSEMTPAGPLTGTEIMPLIKGGANVRSTLADIAAYINSATTPPTVVSFIPANGPSGTEVTITGVNFSGTAQVRFNGIPAASFIVDSNTQIRAITPSGNTTGKINVLTGSGNSDSLTNFDFTPWVINSNEIDVIIINGQSNAIGKGDVGDFDIAPLNAVSPDPRRTFTNVKIWNPKGGHVTFERLLAGTNNLGAWDTTIVNPGYETSYVSAGSELGVGQRYEPLLPGRTLYIIKQVGDGMPLSHWNTGSAGWTSLINDYLTPAFAEITSMGKTPRIRMFLRVQGEADVSTVNYDALIQSFYDRLLALNFIEASTMWLEALTQGMPGVNAYKEAFAAVDPVHRKTIDTASFNTVDGLHYDMFAEFTLGSKLAWNTAFGLTGGGVPVPVAGDHLEETDNRIVLTGTDWKEFFNADCSAGRMLFTNNSDPSGSTWSLTFNCNTGVTLITYQGFAIKMDVYIDGVFNQQFNVAAGTGAAADRLTIPLSPGEHTIQLRTITGFLGVCDAIRIN